jgi:hypothetical protein
MGKQKAKEVFIKLNLDKQKLKSLMWSLFQARYSTDWDKEDGKFIPLASTWLNPEGNYKGTEFNYSQGEKEIIARDFYEQWIKLFPEDRTPALEIKIGSQTLPEEKELISMPPELQDKINNMLHH